MRCLRATSFLLLILAGSTSMAWANKATKLDLLEPSPLTVEVKSVSGEKYDLVSHTDPLEFYLSADCRFDRKPGFQEHDLNELSFHADALSTDLESPFLQDKSLGYWVTTPLDHAKFVLKTEYRAGPGGGRFTDPIKACNDELARRFFNDPSTSREAILAEGFDLKVPDGGRLKVSLTCNPVVKAGFSDFRDRTEYFDLQIRCLPSTAAKAKLVDGETVKIKSFSVVRAKAEARCPAKVPFKASITSQAQVSGQAWLEYLPAGPGSPPAGTSKKVPWSMKKAGQATSTFEQPWNPDSGKWIKGKTRLVVSWKDSRGKTWTEKSAPVSFQRRCTATGGGLAAAPKIDGGTVRIKSFAVQKKKATIKCPGKVTFRATITSKERTSGQVWLETVPKVGRPHPVKGGKKRSWSIKKPGQATSTIEQPWNPSKKGEWIAGRTRLVVSWKDAKGKTYSVRSKPVDFSRQCTKTVQLAPIRR